MSHTYDEILNALANELPEIEKKIFDALKRHPSGVKREQLIAIVFGVQVRAGTLLNNNTRDRRIRIAISRLRKRMVPIISSSSEAGYRLDTSRAAREKMVADLVSRRNELNELILRACKFYEIPEQMPVAEAVKQPPLFEGPWKGVP